MSSKPNITVFSGDQNLSRLPPPPAHLSPEQGALWREVVATKPADWFTEDTQPILEMYCQHVLSARSLSEKISAMEYSGDAWEDLRLYKELLTMRDKETKAAESKARSLRITQQSRWQPKTAASKSAGKANKRPWED